MEKFLIYQVRVNLLQQNIATVDTTNDTEFNEIIKNILLLYREVLELKNDFLIEEYVPQIENLAVILNNKRPFMDGLEQKDDV